MEKQWPQNNSDVCIRCATCMAVCPVSRVTPKFPGPKQVGPGVERFRRPGEPSVDEWIDLCIGCHLCDMVCSSGVNIAELNLIAKAKYLDEKGRPFRDARQVVEGIIYRYRCGIAWRDVPAVFGPWQTIWTWHRRMSAEGIWDVVLSRLLTAAEGAGIIDWAVAVDSTIARAHQHATNITRHTGGWVELQESPRRAA